MLNDVPKDVSERMERIGSVFRELIRDEDDPALVCAVICSNLDVWAKEHDKNAVELSRAIAASIEFRHMFDDTGDMV